MKNASRRLCRWPLLAFLALTSGCDGTISLTIRASEILRVARDGPSIRHLPATIAVNNLEKDEDIAFLKEILRSPGEPRRVKNGDAEAYCFDVQIPLVSGLGGKDVVKDALISIIAKDSAASIDLIYAYNQFVLHDIEEYFFSRYQTRIDPADFSIRLGIINDSGRRLSLRCASVYVDGEAYPFEYTTDLDADARIELVVSEVLTKAIVGDENGMEILRIMK